MLIDGVYNYRKKKHTHGNFGDELVNIVIPGILDKLHLCPPVLGGNRLLSIGSVINFMKDNDTIWGSGVNGKHIDDTPTGLNVSFRAVRGPLTRGHLIQYGYSVPEIYGDPGVLLPEVFPMDVKKKRRYTVVPNYNDLHLFNDPCVVSPLLPVRDLIEIITSSGHVYGSALHAIIVAEAYGIPATLVLPEGHKEPAFKYRDYYEGTGRDLCCFPDLESAASHKPKPFDTTGTRELLIDSFPGDLFTVRGST